ncbi:S24 family peptidase [Paenibacillus larvae]
MKYNELVREYILNSGLSLGEISKKMNEKGVKVDRSYLSKLKNGKVGYPASEEVNKAFAEVTGGDPEKLIFAAFIEKSPDVVNKFFSKAEDLDEFLTKTIEKVQGGQASELVKLMDISERLELIQVIIEDCVNHKRPLETIIKEKEASYEVNDNGNQIVKVPVLGYIAAGLPIGVENVEDFEYVELKYVKGKQAYALRVKGESMIGDNIMNGDIVICIAQKEVTSNEIAVVAVNNESATLKRVKFQNDMCMLIPSHPQMQPMLEHARNVEILGKVVEVRRRFE